MDLQHRVALISDAGRRAQADLTNRIRREFLEMPGLALTELQARRLWNLDSELCDAVLETLVGERFLERSRRGAYLRRAER
jgi:hypothetical protein